MRRFWTYQVRYRIARWLIHAGLIVWPAGRGKTEVIELLWKWRWRVDSELLRRGRE